ncbi:hypothetical protein Leryth_018773 [Lithospermum erythrorhizon]|nr:hypothetical protein Leryth_018773 [Lithospermum erythrorhizon]
MESVVNTALEEIYAQGMHGLIIKYLWPNLKSSLCSHGLPLSPSVKRVLWNNIVDIPGLRFESQTGKIDQSSSLIQELEKCEEINVKIIANHNLHNCFPGITQREGTTLELIATKRSEGIAQSELAEESGMGKDISYILKKLETRGLISREPAIIRTIEASSSTEPKIVSTNMVYLYRYAKHLGCQQSLEITKDGSQIISIIIKDYLPELKAICDRLDNAKNNVLFVSDIKLDPKYRGRHKAWTNILDRLKDARVVEEFTEKVNNKEVKKLRLLKKFSPEHFDSKNHAHRSNEQDAEQSMKLGKRGHVTEQLMELPIDQQIYDVIDAEGSKGLLIPEVSERLGIPKKQCYNRLLNMCSRFGMHQKEENYNRGIAYRVWTSGNFNPEASTNIVPSPQIVVLESTESDPQDRKVESSVPPAQGKDDLVSEDNSRVTGDVPMKDPLQLGADGSLREQRILKMLEEERFLIKPELHRRLESFDKDKKTMMDRKTLERTLNKLQKAGHCKCIHMSVPAITNCVRSRTTAVVLHKSIYDDYDLSPELLGQIHERLRSFEIKIRQKSRSPLNKVQGVPEFSNVQRIPCHTKSDLQSELAEARRTNGFVLAKMVRTKLLHIFLWGYISSSPGWDNDLSYGRQGHDMHNPHSSCKLFEPATAMKAMPIELFLQIVGSTQRFEDMIDKCKRGLRLSDLPLHEYRSLMDTRASGRLSLLIDILRRLKLIRLVGEGTHDISKPGHASLTYALELKPYLEEPASISRSSLGFFSADIHPQIRHDFILSNKKVADEYWNTLEYCYSAADTNAAQHAFPGSAVHEIFRPRSWSSVRLMTAEQRAELLKRVRSEDPDKKFTFRECNEIAKDLNLTMEQVLRVDYDRRRQNLTRLFGKKQLVQRTVSTNISSLLKRKRSSDRKSSKHADGQFCTPVQFVEDHISPDDDEYSLHYDHINEYEEAGEDPEPNEDEDNVGFKCDPSRLKRKRQRKFSWTELADRQLVIEYARNRAALGANFHRTIWASLPNLPATPDECRRRMAMLNTRVPFRKSLMRLCNKLTDRYAKYLKMFQHNPLYAVDSRRMVRDYTVHEDNHHNISDGSQNLESEEVWDNFDEPDVQTALNDVFRYKKIAKPEASKGVGEAEGCGKNPNVGQRSGSNRLPPRYSKFLMEGSSGHKTAYMSVAVSNAIELFKLIFLSTSTAPEARTLLAEKLRCYSEHDLVAAFNFLREKKIMIGGSGNSPLELSRRFLRRISLSPFPVNTGERTAKFAHWLQEKERDLTEEGIELPEDVQYGDLMHLCALISLEELSITPLLPDEGVGEAETFKRKHNYSELCSSKKTNIISRRKLRSSITGKGQIISRIKLRYSIARKGKLMSRRKKGFPGIKLCLNLASISRTNVLQLFSDNYAQTNHVSVSNKGGTRSGMDDCNLLIPLNKPSSFNELHESNNSLHLTDSSVESPWEAMTSFAQHLLSSCSSQERPYSFHPDLFKKASVAIHKAGDQGLNIKEVSKMMNFEDERLLEITIEVLEAFGKVLKVNSFDTEHIVDSLYRSKYFLIPVAGLHQNPKSVTSSVSKEKKEGGNSISDVDDHKGCTRSCRNMSGDPHEVHKVTILNLHEEVSESLQGSQSIDRNVGYTHNECTSAMSSEQGFGSYRSILPWINGDGTINELICKGLVQSVFGIIMKNPGILEEDIIRKLLPILNPQGILEFLFACIHLTMRNLAQSCREMLKLMILDDHISVRKMPQKTSAEPPSILCSILGSNMKKSSIVCRKHFFANPSSTMLM